MRTYIQAAPLGSRIRVCASSDTKTDNYDNSSKGHTMVLVAKDSRAGTFTVLHAGWGGAAATKYTYSGFASYYSKSRGYPYFFYIANYSAADTSSTVSYARISNANAPSALKTGQSYSIKGTISSTTKITSVTVGVYTAQSGGTMKTGRSAAPNRTSYNLSGLNQYVLFGKLSAGTYYYRVTAANSAGTMTLINQKFTVSPDYTYAKISNANAPSALKAGQSYSLKGKITSGTKITSVTAGVYTSSSGTNRLTGRTVSPNSTSYNLTSIDRYVLFGKLSAGTYYYRVTATNSAGTAVLINHKFTVASKLPATWFMLAPKCAPQSRMDVCGGGTESRVNVQLYQSNWTNAQYWYLHNLGNGYYAISSCVSRKYLDVDISNRNSSSDANVWQYQWNGSNAQQWKIIDAGNGYYYLASRLLPEFYLDVSGAGSANGTNIQVYKRNYTDAQKWMFC